MNLPLKRFRQQAHAHEACPCPPETAWNAKHRLSHLIVERNPAEMLATRKHSEFPMFTLTTSNSVDSWLPLYGPVIPSNSPIANLYQPKLEQIGVTVVRMHGREICGNIRGRRRGLPYRLVVLINQ